MPEGGKGQRVGDCALPQYGEVTLRVDLKASLDLEK